MTDEDKRKREVLEEFIKTAKTRLYKILKENVSEDDDDFMEALTSIKTIENASYNIGVLETTSEMFD